MWGEWMKFVVGGDKTKTAYRKAVRARVEAVRNCPSPKKRWECRELRYVELIGLRHGQL